MPRTNQGTDVCRDQHIYGNLFGLMNGLADRHNFFNVQDLLVGSRVKRKFCVLLKNNWRLAKYSGDTLPFVFHM